MVGLTWAHETHESEHAYLGVGVVVQTLETRGPLDNGGRLATVGARRAVLLRAALRHFTSEKRKNFGKGGWNCTSRRLLKLVVHPGILGIICASDTMRSTAI